MDNRSIVGVLVVALAIPGVAALGPDSSPSLAIPDLVPGPAARAADSAQEFIADTIACQQVVRVPVTITYGDPIERKERAQLFPTERTVDVVTGELRTPITETVTEVVWEGSGLLAFLPTITRTVERVTGYDVEPIIEQRDQDYAVDVVWEEVYWDYERTREYVYLPLAAGLQYMDDGASVTHACQDEQIVPSMPAFHNPGHAHWSVCIGCWNTDADHLDGWRTHILSTDVIPVPKPVDGEPRSWCPTDVLTEVEDATDRFVADPANLPALHDELVVPELLGESDAPTTSSGAGVTAATPTGGANILGAIAALFGAVALAGIAVAATRVGRE